ncbi:MAG: hypothetical protein GY933_20855 [Hyphomicrobiales bacterium]|nr:hypothetical protein [Hyphomicrobiales bacterium]
MGLFDWLGTGKKEETAQRLLDHPRDLEVGDIVKFAFAEQTEISGVSFNVDRIRTLDTGGDEHKLTYFLLSDADNKIRLRVVDDDRFEVALEVLPATLFKLFKEDDVAQALDPEGGDHQVLTARKAEKLPPELKPWVGTTYRQEGYVKAYRYEGDYRNRPLPSTVDEGESGCDYAYFITDDRQRGLEFRIFDGGRTEVHLCTFLPLRKIEELWPGGNPSGA